MVAISSSNISFSNNTYEPNPVSSEPQEGIWDDFVKCVSEGYNYCKEKVTTYSEYATLYTGSKTFSIKYPNAAKFLGISLMSKVDRDAAFDEMGATKLNPQETKQKFRAMGNTAQKILEREDQNLYTYILPSDSSISKTISNLDLLKNFFKTAAEKNEIQDVYTWNTSVGGNKDLYLSLGNVSIINIKKVKEGNKEYITGYVEDVYDFASNDEVIKNNETNKQINDKKISFINDIAVDVQNKGMLSNYRVLIPIKIRIK